MRNTIAILGLLVIAAAATRLAGREHTTTATTSTRPTPILVELFTSEGCSSCPPADALLQQFDTQPVPGVQLVVLSEHVDYWNHIGWTDPYSAHAYSERQSAYGRRFRLESVYTPQMVVDGSREFVGGSAHDAHQAFDRARQNDKTTVELSGLSIDGSVLHGRIEAGPLPTQARKVDVIVVVALNRAESQVARGENAGHRLTHVAVVRTLQRVGTAEPGKAYSGAISIPLDRGTDVRNLRVIAFLQETGPGQIWGAVEQSLAH